MATFKLYLQNHEDTRVAIYDPHISRIVWKDNDEILFSTQENVQYKKIAPVSSQNPGKKTHRLKKIKIQLGFNCNFSCNYCSQSNQRSSNNESSLKSLNKAEAFFQKMSSWYDGGEDGKGQGTQIEFWGGETLLYWPIVDFLAEKIKAQYPNVELALYTNGSLVKREMVDKALRYKIHFVVSHDGPTFSEDRGKDPFDVPGQADNLHYLFNILNPEGLISFNAAVSSKNYSLVEIRKYIASKLKVDPGLIYLTNDLVTPYDSSGLKYVSDKNHARELINKVFKDLLSLYPHHLQVGMLGKKLNDLYLSFSTLRTSDSVGQACSMDLPTSIAVDLDGNVLTCQNVTASGGHKIGTVDEFNSIQLNTSIHWSHRSECTKCPVVQVCKGSCMFLKGELWSGACNQHFIWSLAHFSLALYLETNRKLIKIEGDSIRFDDIQMINVLNGVEEM